MMTGTLPSTLAVVSLLACADSPTAPKQPTLEPVKAVYPAERLATLSSPLSLQASADGSALASPTVAIVDAADRLAITVEDRTQRSVLQGHLQDLEKHWSAGRRALARDALKSSRQTLSKIAALQAGSAELDAIELALDDAANALTP